MTAQQLKNSILQMAVQGKLVPQDPNDEPASVLLERIRAEKEQMVKEGKIKKEKNPSIIFCGDDNLPYEKVGNSEPVCIADEVPFEIPASWEWIRFKNFVRYNMGKTPPRKESEYWSPAVYPWVSIADMNANGYIDATKEQVSQTAFNKTFKGNLSYAGTLLMSFKLTVGKVSILNISAFHNEAIISIYPILDDENITRDYLFLTLPLLAQLGETKSAIKGNTLNSKSIDNLFIPVPPLVEQKRIVNVLNDVLPYLERYNDAEIILTTLEADFPDQLKKSILQQAVQGKLVPQDPTDEPASVLLERIRTEKEQLIKDGKIKRDKHESAIYRKDDSYYEKVDGDERCIDDEIPFEIPESWEWARLGSLSSVLGGKRIPAGRKLSQDNTGHIYIRVSDMKDGSVRTDSLLYVPLDIYPAISKYIINKEDIYITVAGTIGAVGKIPPELDGANLTENADRIVFSKIDQDWFICYLSSPFIQSEILRATTQVGQPKLAIKRIEKLLVALPPLKEQKNIVKELKGLITFINCL